MLDGEKVGYFLVMISGVVKNSKGDAQIWDIHVKLITEYFEYWLYFL